MAYEFRLPDVGEGIVEAEIVRWLAGEGERVNRDQPLVEIQTDKAIVEVPAPVSGTLLDRGGREGDTLHVGDLLAVLDPVGQPAAPPSGSVSTPSAPGAAAPAASNGPTPRSEAVAAAAPALRPLATPAVRKLARELGVDLAHVPAGSPDGRISAEDVRAVAARPAPAAAPVVPLVEHQPVPFAQAAPPEPVRPAPSPEQAAAEERVPLRGLRRRIAEAMTQSWRTIPHITGMDEVDVSALVALRERHRASSGADGVHLTYLPFIVRAVIGGLKRYPIVNAVLDESAGEIVYRRRYNIGIATATPDGLIVPVVHDADQKSLRALQEEIATLSEQARARQIALPALQDGTFTITNFGSLGGWLGTPIIRPGEAAILGVGRIQERPWVVDGRIEVRPILALSFSADHRLIDGDVSTAFVSAVAGFLADPLSLFLESA